jgi:ubiquitin-like protein Pup
VISSTARPSTLRFVATRGEDRALPDEIDDVLEENAEEFVRNSVQKGGQ